MPHIIHYGYRRLSLFIGFALLLASLATAMLTFSPLAKRTFAQSAEKKQLFNLVILHVKPDLWVEYEDFLKSTANPLAIKGGQKARYIWRPDRGDRMEYFMFTPMESYATMGTVPDPIRTGLESDVATRLFYQTHRKFLTGQELLTVEAMADISWTNPKSKGQPQIALMRWQTVAPGRSVEYEDFLKNHDIPARRKTADQSNMLGQWRFRVRFGGDVNRYMMLRPMASYAELDEGGTKGLGQILGTAEYQKILNQLPPGVVVQDEAYLIRFRPDLSILPSASSTGAK